MAVRTYRDQLGARIVERAVTSPLSLFLGSAGLLMVTSQPTWQVGAAVLAGNFVLVWTRLRSTRLATEVAEELARHRWWELINRLEAATAELDPATAASLQSMVSSQERLFALYGKQNRMLPATRIEVTSLLEHCVSLAEKRRRVNDYLAGLRTHEVQREATVLQNQADRADDEIARRLYQQSADLKRQELENYLRLGEAVMRIDSQLAAVRCTFDNMLSNVVRMQALEGITHQDTADPIVDEINRMKSGVEALDSSLSEMLVVGAA